MPSPPTFFDWMDQRSTKWMRAPQAPLAEGWYGVTLALVGNNAAESWLLAARFHLLDDPESPDDVLPIIALDRGLPRYALESNDQHRARLQQAWDIYPLGGTEEAIETQLLAAGYGPTTFLGAYGNPNVSYGDSTYFYRDRGAYVEFRPTATGPRGEPAPYRTQFWVVFGTGFHPVTGLPIPWGDFVWGDLSDGVWSYQGYTQEFARTVVGIIRKWKPSDYVCRGLTFLISNIVYRDTSIVYDANIPYGASFDVPIPLS